MSAEMGEYGPVRQTPFKKGWRAGYGHIKACEEWRAKSHYQGRPATKPEQPKNPYPVVYGKGRRGGAYKWDEGFRYGMERAESLARQGMPL